MKREKKLYHDKSATKEGVRTYTMHVRLDGVRHLEVDDERNVLNIDTTTRQIGSDEHVGFSRA